VENVGAQDMMAWITQGPISLREAERLGTSDKGVILYRGVLMEQMERVARGEDPMGVIRDPAENEPMIEIPREGQTLRAFQINRDQTNANMQAMIDKAITAE
jgi:5,5'-dehydrodivanillate O-demethylase